MLALRTAVRKVERLAYSPDGTRLAVTGKGGTEVLDVESQETLAMLDWTSNWEWCGTVAFTKDTHYLIVGHLTRQILIVPIQTLQQLPENFSRGIPQQHFHLLPATGEWFEADTRSVRRWRFGSSRDSTTPRTQGWDYPTGTELHVERLTTYGSPLKVVLLATVNTVPNEPRKCFYILDGETGELLRRCRSGYSRVDHFTGSPCGGYLVGVLQSTLIVWDTAALHLPPKRWANDSRKQFTGVAFHPHGRYLLTASNDKSVKLWDLTCGQVVRSYDWSAGRMRSVAVAPDGLTAAAGSDENLVVLFDLDL